ncbi:MAG: peptidase U32 family protein [Treponemataceae bacterium]
MELLSPAGNIEKLQYAYEYGADAVYIGLKNFSLRVKADNFYDDEFKKIRMLKEKYPDKKIYCALNITFHNSDILNLLNEIDYFKEYPIDAFIVQDIGIVDILKKHFPSSSLHLSTQANCINYGAVKMYKNMGFDRVVLGREAGLAEIAQIKQHVPDVELEAFVHGAMCVSYSGRCLLSAYMNGRSANAGFCSHSCRWDYDLLANPEYVKKLAQSGNLVLREHQRPNEYFPVIEGDNFTAILSSKDLCMIDHLQDLKNAGVDSLKIEGRMKSLYYVALVTRAYRKALDVIEGKIDDKEAEPYIEELYKVKHREFATGFYYNKEDADKTTFGESDSEYDLAATIGQCICEKQVEIIASEGEKTLKSFYEQLNSMHPEALKAKKIDLKMHPEKIPIPLTLRKNFKLYKYFPANKVIAGTQLEYVGPQTIGIQDDSYVFVDKELSLVTGSVSYGGEYYIYTDKDISENFIVRVKDPSFVEGKFRKTGR